MPSVISCWSGRSSGCAVATAVSLNLTPRLFSALLLFVENAGELLDKDALMLALWPGLVVEENSLSQVISGLRRALADDSHDSRYIQTVPRRGFRFIATVTELPDAAAPERLPQAATGSALQAEPPLQPVAAPASERRDRITGAGRRPDRFRTGGAGCAWPWRPALPQRWEARCGGHGAGRRDPAPHRVPSTLAVLPFKPLVSDARDELLEVGMADSLIARLSTVPGLVVRSIGSVRRYAGADQDPLRAARDLDVAWIVDGSLQRRGDQLRVTARLLRAADGSAAWSGSFDEKFTGVFEVQDMISARVAQVLAPSLEVVRRCASAADRARRHAQHRRLPAVSGRGSARPGACAPMACARALTCTSRRWKSTPAMPWPGWGWPKPIGAPCSAPTALPSEVFEPADVRHAARLGRRPEPGRSPCRTGLQALLVRLRLARCRTRVSTSARDQSERRHGPFRTGQLVVEPGPAR